MTADVQCVTTNGKMQGGARAIRYICTLILPPSPYVVEVGLRREAPRVERLQRGDEVVGRLPVAQQFWMAIQ